jgi:hypothetical protein
MTSLGSSLGVIGVIGVLAQAVARLELSGIREWWFRRVCENEDNFLSIATQRAEIEKDYN